MSRFALPPRQETASFAPMRRILRLSVLALPLLALPDAEPLAQSMIRPPSAGQRAPAAPAPALPGLAARRAPAPIPGDPAANLSPNASLFDAIARGDLTAARDAVARGANADARNALGLTALDAAVDQGRNEIAFYLLSARDNSRSAEPEPAPARTGTAAAPPPAARAPRREAPALNTPPVALAQPRSAPLWAGNGGAPQPEIGFLGFDAGRPAGAVAPEATPTPRRSGRS
jgi:hypothetical protein